MSILSVDTIQPIGSGSTVTLNAAKIVVGTGITFESNGQAIYAGIVTANSFSGSISGTTGEFSDDVTITNATPTINLVDSDVSTTATLLGSSGNIYYSTSSSNRDHIFRGSSTEVARITGDGKLGIGTNNPTQLIEVQDKSGGTLCGLSVGTQYGNANFGGYNNYPAIMNSGNQPLIYCDTNNDRTVLFGDTVGFGTTCAFRVNNAERLRITSAGLVGIGTDTPYNPLEVVGSSADIMVYDTDAYSQNVSGGALAFAGKDSAGNRKTLADVRGVANGANIGEFAIRTRRSGGTLTEALRITSDGSTQINSGVLQRRYESSNTAGYRYYSKADRFLIAHGGSGTNLTITGMTQGWASIRFGGYTEGQRVNFRADIAGYNAGNAGVRLYDSNEITNQATSYSSGSCSITVTKNNASYVVNVTQSNPQGNSMASFYHFESGGYNSVSTLTIS